MPQLVYELGYDLQHRAGSKRVPQANHWRAQRSSFAMSCLPTILSRLTGQILRFNCQLKPSCVQSISFNLYLGLLTGISVTCLVEQCGNWVWVSRMLSAMILASMAR
eukprot:5079729-Amphidinium_carterae.2